MTKSNRKLEALVATLLIAGTAAMPGCLPKRVSIGVPVSYYWSCHRHGYNEHCHLTNGKHKHKVDNQNHKKKQGCHVYYNQLGYIKKCHFRKGKHKHYRGK
ncbi:hypothetical protein HOC35_00280 [Candidatus Woesearchaeota archaeon]|jgi:hypothetical protein|nr:hypothetical protein [Candidatus Woesearchaeota archaeon]